jgi:ABC-type uncharacterized transport system substrate-binding protein
LRIASNEINHPSDIECILERRATQLVHMNVDVIFAPASTQVEPARKATTTIPIVFAQHADPVGLGDVASLSRPGGNITGLSMLLTELSVKQLEILKETLPHATRIGVLWNPTTPSHPTAMKAIKVASEKLGVQLLMVPAGTVTDIEGGFSTMTRERVGGVLVLGSPLFNAQGTLLAELQVKHQLPEIFSNKANVDAGGLMSYGADFDDLYRRAATYIDKILKGTKPADLPVEQASKILTCRQPQGREGTWPNDCPYCARPRRRGDRMRRPCRLIPRLTLAVRSKRLSCSHCGRLCPRPEDEADEATGVHHSTRWHSGQLAARGASRAAGDADDWLPRQHLG